MANVRGAACRHCGAAAADPDASFCPACGIDAASVIADRVDAAASSDLAGCGDLGRARHRNEDFFVVAATPGVDVAVVCDGVSHSQRPDRAAKLTAGLIGAALAGVNPDGAAGDLDARLRSALRDAIASADLAVRALASDPAVAADPPETTVVAAIRCRGRLAIAWLGDSRAYWLDSNALRLLTRDHSWLNEVTASGELPLDEALRHPHARAITRTLGGPAGLPMDEPSIGIFGLGDELPLPGRLLICSDGFWDCGVAGQALPDLVLRWVAECPPASDALALARALVDGACRNRGHDNVTVAVLTVNDGPAAERSA